MAALTRNAHKALDKLFYNDGDGQRVGRWITYGVEDLAGGVPLYYTHPDGTLIMADEAGKPDFFMFVTPDWDEEEQVRTDVHRSSDGEHLPDLQCDFDEHTSWTNDPARDLQIWKGRVADFIRCIVDAHPNSEFAKLDHGLGAAKSAPVSVDPRDVETINRHRNLIGAGPIDLGAGWSAEEIREMAENIRTRGRTHVNPKLKRNLMR